MPITQATDKIAKFCEHLFALVAWKKIINKLSSEFSLLRSSKLRLFFYHFAADDRKFFKISFEKYQRLYVVHQVNWNEGSHCPFGGPLFWYLPDVNLGKI
jgi:hypothetical protein